MQTNPYKPLNDLFKEVLEENTRTHREANALRAEVCRLKCLVAFLEEAYAVASMKSQLKPLEKMEKYQLLKRMDLCQQ